MDAGACPVGTPDCRFERVLQDLSWPTAISRRDASGAGCLPLALPGHVDADTAVRPAGRRTG